MSELSVEQVQIGLKVMYFLSEVCDIIFLVVINILIPANVDLNLGFSYGLGVIRLSFKPGQSFHQLDKLIIFILDGLE